MAAEIVHGTWRGLKVHNRAGERLCPECATWTADRNRAYRIASGEKKAVRISTIGLARILRGWDVNEVLAAEFGPQTLETLRGYRAGEQRA